MAILDPSLKTTNPIKQRLLQGETLYGGWATMGSTIGTEILGHAGFDWVLIDGEHGANDYSSFVQQLLALNTGPAAAFARPDSNDTVTLKRLLDFGFYNFLIPTVDTHEHALAAVQATRYPPEGIRGVSVSQRSNRFGIQADYFQEINHQICVVAQIESQRGVDNVEAIAGVPGIDALFIGPQDLAASMGYLAQPMAEPVQAAIQSLTQRIRALGKPVGILAADENDAHRYRAWGATFIGIGSDHGLIRRGAAQILTSMRG